MAEVNATLGFSGINPATFSLSATTHTFHVEDSIHIDSDPLLDILYIDMLVEPK